MKTSSLLLQCRRALPVMALASILVLAGTQTAMGQTWPDRPIKFVVPFAAGSGTDNRFGRLLDHRPGLHGQQPSRFGQGRSDLATGSESSPVLA